MILMCGISTAEVVIIVGPQGGRLSWPYGDLVPGTSCKVLACRHFYASVARQRPPGGVARVGALTALLSIVLSVLTGERINFLIRSGGGNRQLRYHGNLNCGA